MRVLVTGATGYVGGRLIPDLLERGEEVRVLVRDPRRVAGRPWSEKVQIFQGDLLQPETLQACCRGVDVAYYLVHSMQAGAEFAERDRKAARNYGQAASHIPRTIYLGGLLPEADRTSEHLASRAEVGEILREMVPTLEFRAGPIIGSGSASFEMVRYLTERLPAMVAPKWIRNLVQPIGVDDILHYLVSALDIKETGVVEVGTDRLSFKEMMHRYAEVRGLHRVIVPVPVLAPKLAALWVGLVTPIPNRIAVPLVQGVVHAVIADTSRAEALFPSIQPMSYRDAVARAVEAGVQSEVETHWSGALVHPPGYELEDREGMVREIRNLDVDAAPGEVYRAFASLGGKTGWLVWNQAWKLRGLADRIFGGPGLRRGRRHPLDLFVGEAVDFWRVEAAEPEKMLRLRAEMKVPGRAWLQWEALPREGGGTRLVQTALFAPKGLAGTLYWYGLYPIHRLIFSDLAAAVAKRAENKI